MRPHLLALCLLLPALIPAASAQPRARATLFQDNDYRGEQRMVDREVRDFRDIGFNDRVSSIRVESGSWEFCEDADFRGRCITVNRDTRSLNEFNDRISSARPVADRDDRRGDNRDNNRGGGFNRGADVTLYADIDYRGASKDAGESRDFRNLDFNDTVSSIRIRNGAWQFCTDADFRGNCMTFDRDVPTLVPYGLNDAISSMRRVR